MKIRLIGKRNNLGIGIHFTGFADTIKRMPGISELVEEIDFENADQIRQASLSSCPDDINISFVAGNIQDVFRGHVVQWVVFESSKIPSKVFGNLLLADSIWVPSNWGRQILMAHNIDLEKISVVPEGVNTGLYHPYARVKSDRPFRFLFVGKYEERKSCQETISAFAQSFGNSPDVELVIKTHYMKKGLTDVEQQITKLNLNNVGAIIGAVDNLQYIYNQCDILVAPTKGEAWGLPIIEAAASGLPIITTYYSGHTEYLQHITNSVVPVDYQLFPIDCEIYKECYPETDNNWGQWAVPDIDNLAEAMMLSKTHKDYLAENAFKNSKIIRTRFSWQNSVDIAIQTLKEQGLL